MLDEQAWNGLLSAMEAGRVVPILGAELLTVQTPEGPRHLHDWLASRLAAELDLGPAEPAGLPAPACLADVLLAYGRAHGRRDEVYTRAHALLRQANITPPASLYKLAAITDLSLFLSTGFDLLMSRALNDVRGVDCARSLSYTPTRRTDLPAEPASASRPLVFHLCGAATPWPGYALSPEDQLEALGSLFSDDRCPPGLSAALQPCHLLVIGSELDDAVLQLLLRVLRRERLSRPRPQIEWLADARQRAKGPLVQLLRQSGNTVYAFDGADAFIDELHRRWLARRPVVHLDEPVRMQPPAAQMPEGAVYLCHARQDLARVQTLKAGLDGAAISSWFDPEPGPSDAGDPLDARQRTDIERCARFVAVISRHTGGLDGEPGPCSREWAHALDVARQRADGAQFIQTVMVEPLTPDDEGQSPVPTLLRGTRLHWLPDGQLREGLVEQLSAPSALPRSLGS